MSSLGGSSKGSIIQSGCTRPAFNTSTIGDLLNILSREQLEAVRRYQRARVELAQETEEVYDRFLQKVGYTDLVGEEEQEE